MKPTGTDKLLNVLMAFETQGKWSLGNLSRTLSLPKSTIHRLLSTLKSHGFVEQDEQTSHYYLGGRILRLADAAVPYGSLRLSAHMELENLAAGSRETAFLTVPDGMYSYCVDRVVGSQELRFAMPLGSKSPLYLGASNTIILAFLSDEIRDKVLAYWLKTEEVREQARDELQKTRERGYAYSAAQLTEGVAAIAVPVLDENGSVLAGLSVGGYIERLTEDKALVYLADLRLAGRSISDALSLRQADKEGA